MMDPCESIAAAVGSVVVVVVVMGSVSLVGGAWEY